MVSILELVKPDYDKIKEVLRYSQNIADPKIDKLLAIWANSKQILSNKFLQGNLSYTYPEEITFSLSPAEKEKNFSTFIDMVEGYGEKTHWLIKFLSAINADDFYNNYLPFKYIMDADNEKIIPQGSKIIKSFKYFIEDKQILAQLQMIASMYIQENKINGYLTFSIHPLDFLSSSGNTYNWRSCHSLDSEYRAGNLSYICDYGTMIVYLSPNTPEKLPNFPTSVPWNSKKWRMLMHFNTSYDVCFAGRQYPFVSKEGLDKIYEVFDNKLNDYRYNFWQNRDTKEEWSGWKRDYITDVITCNNQKIPLNNENICVINNYIYKLSDIVEKGEGACNYNDLLHSTVYNNPYYMYVKCAYSAPSIDVIIGEGAPCIKCGQHAIKIKDTMLCPECAEQEEGNNIYCEGCGCRIYPEVEEIRYLDGEPLCNRCYNEETFICDECGERHFDLWSINNDKLCDECYHKRMEER